MILNCDCYEKIKSILLNRLGMSEDRNRPFPVKESKQGYNNYIIKCERFRTGSKGNYYSEACGMLSKVTE